MVWAYLTNNSSIELRRMEVDKSVSTINVRSDWGHVKGRAACPCQGIHNVCTNISDRDLLLQKFIADSIW